MRQYLLLASMGLLCATSAQAAVALQNGSFESIGQEYSPAIGGLYEATGWVNTSGLNIQASSALSGVEGTPPAVGARFLRLVSDNPDPQNTGSIYQNLGTIVAGQSYVISGIALGGESVNNAWGGIFTLSSAPSGAGSLFATTTVLGLTEGATANFSFGFLGTAANAGQSLYLSLAATPSGPGQDTRGGVDNLQLTAAAPEPAMWATMLLGFGLVGSRLRYRRKSASVSFG